MKKIFRKLAVFAVGILIAGGFFILQASAATLSGSGTQASPYLITNESVLRQLATNVKNGNSYSGKYFRVTANIALTQDWTPIGTAATPFRGSFDGNSKTISGMTVTGEYVGLFAYVGSGATVQNVTLTDFTVNGKNHVAGLIANADAGTGSIIVSNCSVSGTLRDTDDTYADGYLAGIVGHAKAKTGNITISGCTSSGSYTCDIYSGGIVGYGESSNKNLKIQNCTNNAYISVYNCGNACGGIVGYISGAELEGCINYGSVSGNAYSEDNGTSWLGGIAGYGSSNTFIGCTNYGNISTFFAGGITPSQSSNTAVACLNAGKLSHSSDGYGSALIRFGYVINSYYLYGPGITGATAVSTAELKSGYVAHALRDYLGQTIGTDQTPVALTSSNRVYKVSVVGEVSGSYYTNSGKTVALPALSACAAYFDGETKFNPATTITRDYALVAKAYHNLVDGVCTDCGSQGSTYVSAGSCGTSVAWTLSQNGELTITGTGAMTDYTGTTPWSGYASQIQSVNITKGVTTAGNYAFKGLTNLTSVTIADTVSTIGKYAFYGCTKLTSLTIPNGVTGIGDYAFAFCTGVNSLNLGKQLTTIGNYTFYQCTSLRSVTLSVNVTALGNSAFQGCTQLQYLSLSNVKTIGSYALSSTALYSLSIPATVTQIGAYAFTNNASLTEVTFQGAAPTIASTAFSGLKVMCLTPAYDSSWNTNIQQNFGGTLIWAVGGGTCGSTAEWVLDFNGTLTVSGSGAMSNYSASNEPWVNLRDKILSVVISDGITTIGDYAFYNCSNLRSVTIADSVTKIGNLTSSTYSYACSFARCTSLTQFTVPKNVSEVAYSTFLGCSSLTSIDVASGNAAYTSVDGVLYDRYKTTLHSYPAGKTGVVTIPASVDTIAAFAFADCTGVTKIVFPSSVTSIEHSAFEDCSALKTVTFEGNAPTYVGTYAFLSVTADAYFPAGDTTWTTSSMKSCGSSLKWHIATGSCGTNVQWELLYTNGATTLTISGSGAMSDFTADTIPWKNYLADVRTFIVNSGVTSVGANALCMGTNSAVATSLTTVTLADSVTSIGNDAFRYCTKLSNLTLGNGLKTIGESAFVNTAVSTINFPESLQTVGKYAFQSCYSLKTLTFGSKLQTIGYTAFASCTALQSVDLGTSVTTLEQSAFNGCSKLTKIVIPASVTSVGTYAFRNCTGLQYIEFKGNAPTFNTNAFYGTTCHAYYPSSKTGWGSSTCLNYGGTVTWGAISQRGICGSNADWFLDTAGNLLICGSGAMPSYSETNRAPWYDYRTNIQMITVRGVTTIGAYAFNGCTVFDQMTLPSTISSVGNYAFADCAQLQLVIFEGSAPSFGTSAFSGTTCEIWYKSSWSTSVRKDYGGTLTWRKATAIGTCGVNAKWILDSSGALVVLGSGDMTHYSYASSQPWYNNNTAITSVIIGGKVTKVSKYAFSGCTNLRTVTFGNAVTEIYDYAFSKCTALQTLTFHDGVTDIGDYAFSGCTSLQSVTIGKGMDYIDLCAFSGCTALTEVTFQGNAPGIAYNAFSSVVATVYYPMFNSTWTSSVMYDHGGTLTWGAMCMNHKEVIQPAVAATCTQAGKTEGKYCSLCDGVLIQQEVIPAKGHYALGPDNTPVPADTLDALCLEDIPCTVCRKVAVAAQGHRVLGTVPVEVDPLTVKNPTTYPFSLVNDTYYSTNKANSSSSVLEITAQYNCSLTLNYGVSSEEDYDKLTILLNGSSKDTISGIDTGSITLTLKAGDVVGVRYKKDSSASEGEDRGWVKLIYSPVMVDGIGDVPADTSEPDCTNGVVCRYCQTVVKEALGHRVILELPEPEIPYEIVNATDYPFALTGNTYYSTNKAHSSTSELLVNIKNDCKLTLNYGVSSEPTSDTLTIFVNAEEKRVISGLTTNQTITLQLVAGDVVAIRYSKDSSISRNDDKGWVSVVYQYEPVFEIVPADTVEPGCEGVTCDYCKILVKEGLGHVYTSVITEPTCTEKGYTTHTCHCGDSYVDSEVNALDHSFTNYISNNDATCLEDGTKTAKCDRCEVTDTLADADSKLGHSFTNYISNNDATCLEDGTKTAKCDRCEVTDTLADADSKLGHSFTNYISNGDATCEDDGTKTAKCDRCDVTDTQADVGSAKGHDHTAVVTAPTCTEKGYTTHTCHCGDSYVDSEVNALDHSFTNYVSNNDATCLMDGTKTAKCDRCTETDTKADTGSKLGHSFTNYLSNGDATCEDDGTKTAKCDRCTATDTETDTGSKLGHSFTNYISNNDATCLEDGTKTAKCDRCTETSTKTDTGSATGHTYVPTVVPPTCEEAGYTEYLCHCSDSYTDDYVDPLGHSFTNYVSNNDATCVKDGTKTAKCDRCSVKDTKEDTGSATGHTYVPTVVSPTCEEGGYTEYQCHCTDRYVDDYVDPLGHSFTNYVSNNDATCVKDGTKTAKCDRCSVKDTKTDTGTKLGHSFTNYISDNNATYDADGTKTATCDRCTATDTVIDFGTKLGTMVGIGIEALPNKLTYTEGEAFNPAGMVVKAYFNDNTSAEITGYTVTGYDAKPGTKTITVTYSGFTASFTVTVNEKTYYFPDVSQKDWFYNAVQYAVRKGYFSGHGNGTFGAHEGITREDFVVVLARIEGVNLSQYSGKTSFKDVSPNAYYAKAIHWASSNQVVMGYNDTEFGVKDTITREQMVTILYRYAMKKGYDISVNGSGEAKMNAFADKNKVSFFAKAACCWALEKGVLGGKNATTFDPGGEATRAQVAQILMNISTKKIMPF